MVLGWSDGTPRISACASSATCMLFMTRHVVFECPAMQPVRDHYPALFSPAQGTMQLVMRQQAKLGMAHTTSWIVLMPFVPCLMLLMMHQSHLHQPWRLDRCNTVTHSDPVRLELCCLLPSMPLTDELLCTCAAFWYVQASTGHLTAATAGTHNAHPPAHPTCAV